MTYYPTEVNYEPQEVQTEWRNYGDANPRIHGGRFIRFDESGEYWQIIETRDLQEVGPQDMIRNGERFMFEDKTVYPDDVWVDGDPMKGFTDAMVSIFESLGDGLLAEPPEGKPAIVVDRPIEYYIADLPQYARLDTRDTYHGDYWDSLEDKGVDTEQYKD
jgi:hypothetical protein